MHTESMRPRWLLVAALSVFGVGLIGWAKFVHTDYWQALMLHFGTAIALFAILALLEPYLKRQIRVALRPHTLVDAQTVLRAKLGAKHSEDTHDHPAESVDHAIRWVGDQLQRSGFQQMPVNQG